MLRDTTLTLKIKSSLVSEQAVTRTTNYRVATRMAQSSLCATFKSFACHELSISGSCSTKWYDRVLHQLSVQMILLWLQWISMIRLQKLAALNRFYGDVEDIPMIRSFWSYLTIRWHQKGMAHAYIFISICIILSLFFVHKSCNCNQYKYLLSSPPVQWKQEGISI